MSQGNVETARLLFDYFNAGDLAGLERITDPVGEIVPLRAARSTTSSAPAWVIQPTSARSRSPRFRTRTRSSPWLWAFG